MLIPTAIEQVQTNPAADGWTPAGETWTYASADDPTFTFTIAGVDLTTKYSPGMRVKLTQTTVKYFIITKVAFSTDTTITVYGGTDYTLANATITSPFWSMLKAPFGFPLDPAKWTVEVADSSLRAQATPTANTWYNVGSVSISVPVGCWRFYYSASPQASDASGSDWNAMVTLSTANNSESDADMTAQVYSGNAAGAISASVTREKFLALAAKTSYFLNLRTTNTGLDNLYLRGDVAGGYGSRTIIRAVCAYL